MNQFSSAVSAYGIFATTLKFLLKVTDIPYSITTIFKKYLVFSCFRFPSVPWFIAFSKGSHIADFGSFISVKDAGMLMALTLAIK